MMSVCVLIVATVVQVPSSAAADLPARTAAGVPSWLARVNAVRTDAGVPRVVADNSAVAGIRKHLIYLRKTPASLQRGRYASAHSENPASRYYSTAGAREAASSDLTFGSSSDLGAINAWLGAPFHAIGMLRPGLTRVGYYRDPASGYAGLDIISHLSSGSTKPVLYPRKTLDLSRFGGESPDPVQTCRHAHPGRSWSAAGFPLIALLPRLTSTDGISAELTEPDGHTISTTGDDLCLVDASTFYSTDTVYGPTGRSILTSDHALLLIPRRPVTAGRYTVHLNLGSSYPGPAPQWSFTSHPTGAEPSLASWGARCSYTNAASGSVSISLTNPLDDAGRATFRVGSGAKSMTRSVADGASVELRFTKLSAGKHVFTATGSDGTRSRLSVRVARCAAWRAARASVPATAGKRTVVVRFDNKRNRGTVRYTVFETGRATRTWQVHGGAGRSIRIVLPRAHRGVRIAVYVAGHRIAQRRY